MAYSGDMIRREEFDALRAEFDALKAFVETHLGETMIRGVNSTELDHTEPSPIVPYCAAERYALLPDTAFDTKSEFDATITDVVAPIVDVAKHQLRERVPAPGWWARQRKQEQIATWQEPNGQLTHTFKIKYKPTDAGNVLEQYEAATAPTAFPNHKLAMALTMDDETPKQLDIFWTLPEEGFYDELPPKPLEMLLPRKTDLELLRNTATYTEDVRKATFIPSKLEGKASVQSWGGATHLTLTLDPQQVALTRNIRHIEADKVDPECSCYPRLKETLAYDLAKQAFVCTAQDKAWSGIMSETITPKNFVQLADLAGRIVPRS